MANYEYRLIRKEVVEEGAVRADSRDEALGHISDYIIEDLADGATYEVEWIDGEED
jgi:hypothetical protein